MKHRIFLTLAIVSVSVFVSFADDTSRLAQQMVAALSTDIALDNTQMDTLLSVAEQYYTAVQVLVTESTDAVALVNAKSQLNAQFMEHLQ